MAHHLPENGTMLHVGCGPLQIDATPFGSLDWQEIRLDIDPATNPDLLGTMTDMACVPTASIDAVFSAHNIEHLEAHEVPTALAEFRRVLRPSGILLITCPDVNSIAARILSTGLTSPAYLSGMGPISPLDMLYGHGASLAEGKHYMAHRCGFNEASLKASIETAGFAQVVSMSLPHHFDLWALATVENWPEDKLCDAALRLLPIMPNG